MNTGRIGREHGCANKSKETHRNCCGSLRHEAEFDLDVKGADELAQTRVDDY